MAHRVLSLLVSARRRARVLVAVAVLAGATGTTVAWSAAAAVGSAPPRAEDGAGPGRPAPVPQVAFECDPSRSHGENVSAYARSLPRGPGRGQQVSAAARSDCGKGDRGGEDD